MHVGGIRTALFAWAYARNQQGSFILRIEDTDKKRQQAGAIEHITESLDWLGLDRDEEPGRGEYGPYIQSERLDLYKKYAQQLIDQGLAYADPYTPDQLEAFRQEAKAAKAPFLYRNHRPDKPPAWDGSQPLRFKIPEIKRYRWFDVVRGEMTAGEDALDDFIIIKADGMPTYNFAHVVDDFAMNITHVMRGEEFIASTPKFLSLHDALGWKYPKFVTLPPVLAMSGGKKLSKRDGAEDVLSYKQAGYLPEALINFLAGLGWNDGSEQEVYTPEEIVAKFSLKRIQKAGARFDREKLDWLNWQHFKRRLGAGKVQSTVSLLPDSGQVIPADMAEQKLESAARLAATKANSPESWLEQIKIFTHRPDPISQADLEQVDSELDANQALENLGDAIESLRPLDQFSTPEIEQALRQTMTAKDYQPRIFLNLARWAISGQKVSPSLFEMIAVLGRDESLARLEAAAASIRSAQGSQ